jgi:hypothetical protein
MIKQIADEAQFYASSPTQELKNVRKALRFHSHANTAQERARLIAVENLLKTRSRRARRGGVYA